MEDMLDKLVNGLISFGGKLFVAILIIVVGFKFAKFIMNKLKKGRAFNKLEKSSQTFLCSIVNVIIKAMVLLIAITEIGIPMASIISLIGSFGVALGLALQGGLSNIAGGVTIMLFKPFKVGDYIDTHSDAGTVKDINIFSTVLQTYDNKLVVIPNGTLANTTIVNQTATKTRLLDIPVTVDYRSDIDKVKEILNKIIKESKYRLDKHDTLVALKEHGESALVFTTRMWVTSENYWPATYEMLETIKKEFDKEGISIPYPQLDVHLDK